MSRSRIYVTEPSLPPLEEFVPYLQEIWASKQLSNGGPFHQRLEDALCQYLGVKHISLVTNGTLALMVALKAIGVQGEVITTPYSFVATAQSLLWNQLKPVFVDVDPATGNIDPAKVAEAITPSTSAILGVHCYGNPCDIEEIDRIAKRHKLKVVYDAAHAFGVNYKSESLLSYGDISAVSFHATKVFNTFEGGAIVSPDKATKKRVDDIKNFSLAADGNVLDAGINGKMSEVNAAFGLLQLDYVDKEIASRRRSYEAYSRAFEEAPGLRCIPFNKKATPNGSYFPLLVEDGRDELVEHLAHHGIFARKYFYPLITDMDMFAEFQLGQTNLGCAKTIAEQVVCLPMSARLTVREQDRIIELVNAFLR
ncbi:DegT/DnrJ/EryC1/StrS family aminotransferase [uncultured Spongiibacter sp.]|uniref:DegT/DnrJ/EryC1/StrS family aminotransferase n=1 Tax=uncultured Spongiibacter sp. TaxID=870896 RepID=UPI00258C5286|nr:DegT/DnrJ/EryC1/StrS family aminotransferase [uncultured Spongiibacter sp.]